LDTLGLTVLFSESLEFLPETQIFLNNHIRCVERIKMKKEFLETTNPRGPTSSNINIISSSTTLKTSKGSYIT
ncbi:unnamed protein product, partial [Allacma fusca]